MLKVVFWQEQSKFEGGSILERYAQIVSKEEDLSRKDDDKFFLRVIADDGEDVKVNGVALLETEDADIIHNPHAFEITKKIVERLDDKPDVICSTSLKHLLQISRDAEEGEFDLKILPINSQKEALYYGRCGQNDSTLLLAYGLQDEVVN